MMKIIRWILLLGCIFCLNNPVFADAYKFYEPKKIEVFPIPTLPIAPKPEVTVAKPSVSVNLPTERPFLKNEFVYIYNFLDIRDQDFGSQMIDQLDSQIVNSFLENSIKSKVLRFKNSSVGEYYAPPDPVRTYTYMGYHTQSNVVIPVNEVISSNQADEVASGAKYRLIEFPTNFNRTGAWQNYEIRWTLFDIKTNALIWTYIYHNQHLTLLRSDEGSKHRSKETIDAVIDNLHSVGLM